MHFRSFSKLTSVLIALIVFASCVTFLSVRQTAFAKSYACSQPSGSGISAIAEAMCNGQPKAGWSSDKPVSRSTLKGMAGLARPGASNTTYYYAGGTQDFTADGASGNFNQDMPSLGANGTHSLAELGVESADELQSIEVGWTVDPGLNHDNTPHLFVYHTVDGTGKCYNACGYVQVSKNFKPGDPVTVDKKPNATHQYAIEFMSGNWWIWYENEWIGYFPGTLWTNFTQVGRTQWFGEVAVPKSQQFPCSQMGDGLYGTSKGSAVINTMYFFVNGSSVNADEQELQPNPSYYNVGHFKPNSFTYGGPGDTKHCPKASAGWPMYGYDDTGTRYNPNEHTISPSSAGQLIKGWSALGGGDANSPVVANSAVYVGGADGKLYALDASTGNSLWSSDTIGGSSAVFSTPAVTNRDVYVGSADGNLYALSVSTGKTLWKYPTGGTVNSSPTVANGVVYFGSADGNLYAVNASTGQLSWPSPFSTGGGVYSTPAVVNGVVYFSSSDYKLYAVNASTGKSSWTPMHFICAPGSPAVANTVLYVVTGCGDLYAINPSSGAMLWTEHTLGQPTESVAVANNVIYIGFTYGNYASIYAFDATKKAPPLWTYLTDGYSFNGSPAVANGVVYIGSDYGSMYAFDATKKVPPIWKYPYGGTVFSSPIVANGVVYVGEFGAYLDTFHLPS